MNIAERVEAGINVFVPEGRIDTQAAADLDKALQAAVSQAKYKMVMDMSGVTYISSAGLRALAAVQVKNKEEGGDLKLGGLNERVTRVFRIIGFDMFFSIHDTAEAAIADFSSSEGS
jgi:anti-anti-sigma factor